MALEQLASSQADMAKVRTLDLDVHIGTKAAADTALQNLAERDLFERQVRVLEALRGRFRVTGSNLEVYRQGWRPEADCPEQECQEPSVHVSGGFSPQRFAVSLVNRDALAGGGGGSGARGSPPTVQRPPAAAQRKYRPAPAPAPVQDSSPPLLYD